MGDVLEDILTAFFAVLFWMARAVGTTIAIALGVVVALAAGYLFVQVLILVGPILWQLFLVVVGLVVIAVTWVVATLAGWANQITPPVIPTPRPAIAAPAPAPAPQGATCNPVREDRKPAGQTWSPSGDGWRIVNFWTNEPGFSQQERKLLLAPGGRPNLRGGGSSWSYPAVCEAQARADFGGNKLPEVKLADLAGQNLVAP